MNDRRPPAASQLAILLMFAITLELPYGGPLVWNRSRLRPRRLGCIRRALERHELSITCGYHACFARHLSSTSRVEGGLSLIWCHGLQNSALVWSAGHRVHHRFIDDPERDPYCARRGFWFSHIAGCSATTRAATPI